MNDYYVSLLRLSYFILKGLVGLTAFFALFYIPYRKRKLKKTTPPTDAYIQANQTEALTEDTHCPHCHSKKLVRGEFYQQGRRESVSACLALNSIEFYDRSSLKVKPKHPTIYRLTETYFNCCAECGYVFATADTAKVYEILQTYAKPELLKRLGIAKLE